MGGRGGRREARGEVAIVTGASGASAERRRNYGGEAPGRVNYLSRQDEARSTAGPMGPDRALLVQADVSTPDGARALVERTAAAFGTVDILVNNAGMIIRDSDWRESLGNWNRTIAANLTSAWLTSREVAPIMLAGGGGTIVNISSIYGVCGAAAALSYSSAKSGVIAMTQALAKHLAPTVRVNAIAPGNVLTDMTAAADQDVISQIEHRTPLRRSAVPAEVARAVLFMASDDASYVTPVTLLVDGGHSLA